MAIKSIGNLKIGYVAGHIYYEKRVASKFLVFLNSAYNAHDLKPFAEDLGYDGPPFPWNPERRSILRAELDAFYAKLYGLTRDELRYILRSNGCDGRGLSLRNLPGFEKERG